MKKLTRKLFISILSMAFAVIAIGTTTFAWITVSNTATVNAFGGSVEAGVAGIELSIDNGATWQSNISLDSMIASGFKFSDVTTNDGTTFSEYTFSGTSGTATSADGKYIELSFYIRRSDYAANPTGKLPVYVENVIFTNNESGDLGYKLEYDLGQVTDGYKWSKDQTYNFLRVENAARLLISVETGNQVVYEQTKDAKENTLGYDQTGFAHLYWMKKNPTISLPTYSPVGTEDGSVGKPYQAGTTSGLLVELGNAAGGYKVTVKVWVEGFDNECHSKILGQGFKVKFGFTTTSGATI